MSKKNQKGGESKFIWKKRFKRHFRIYLVNNHPAYIVDENGDYYVFHRSSHKNKISSKATFEIKKNPIVGDLIPMYIAKRRQTERMGLITDKYFL